MGLDNFIQKFDLFSQPIQLSYKGLPYYGTNCGGAITLAVIFVLIGLFIQRIIDMLEKQVPRLFESIEIQNQPITILADGSSISLNRST